MRYLAVDLGEKRTGLAVGDDETALVSPIRVIQCAMGDQLLDALLAGVEEQGAQAIVIGLPLNMDGTEGPQARRVREFAERVRSRFGSPVHLQDERLTSAAAEEHLKQSGKTHRQKKSIRDALAAAEILSDFLEEQKKR